MNDTVILHLDCDKVSIGDRRREEYGAVDELAASIARYGLLHPIVVAEEDADGIHRLVAGGRRLTAVRTLGWENIPARLLGTLTDAELREVELEENLQRKDLTSYELSKNLTELAETAAAVDKETRTESVRVSEGRRGPAQTPGSLRRVSERIGVPVQTIRDARQHVAAVEQHPILKDEPQSTAIDYAKAVRQEPTLMGSPIARTVEHYRSGLAKQREQAAPAAEVERVMASLPPPPREPDEEKRYRTLIESIERLMSQNPPDHFADDEPQRWTRDLDSSLKALNEWASRTRAALDSRASRPLRAVK